MKMYSRLNYLYTEGFDICSIMGYDGEEDQMGEGKIVYRAIQADGKWRLYSEVFTVGYDEMQACTRLYMQNLHA